MLHHCRVLLRSLIDRVHRRVDLLDAGGLFAGAFDDRRHVAADLLDLGDDAFERRAGFAHQRDAGFDLLARCGDQHLDLLGGLRRALGELAHLLGDDGKALAGLAGAGRLDAGIQRQEVRLKGDVVDDADDAGDFPRRGFDATHRGDGVADDLAGLLCCTAGARHQGACLLRTPAGIRHGGRDLVQCSCRFLDRSRLLFCALGKVTGRRADFAGAGIDAAGVLAD
ncbi:hypothetical protein D9M72_473940 [compost metagenome]